MIQVSRKHSIRNLARAIRADRRGSADMIGIVFAFIIVGMVQIAVLQQSAFVGGEQSLRAAEMDAARQEMIFANAAQAFIVSNPPSKFGVYYKKTGSGDYVLTASTLAYSGHYLPTTGLVATPFGQTFEALIPHTAVIAGQQSSLGTMATEAFIVPVNIPDSVALTGYNQLATPAAFAATTAAISGAIGLFMQIGQTATPTLSSGMLAITSGGGLSVTTPYNSTTLAALQNNIAAADLPSCPNGCTLPVEMINVTGVGQSLTAKNTSAFP